MEKKKNKTPKKKEKKLTIWCVASHRKAFFK